MKYKYYSKDYTVILSKTQWVKKLGSKLFKEMVDNGKLKVYN